MKELKRDSLTNTTKSRMPSKKSTKLLKRQNNNKKPYFKIYLMILKVNIKVR